MTRLSYPPRVEAIIYDHRIPFDAFAPNDWVELALAALDQAGLCSRDQDRIRRMLHAMVAAPIQDADLDAYEDFDKNSIADMRGFTKVP